MGEAEQNLAAWRRAGKGIWYVTVVIDGYDEVFNLLYPGGLSRRKASRLAQREIARLESQCPWHVHVTHIEKRDH